MDDDGDEMLDATKGAVSDLLVRMLAAEAALTVLATALKGQMSSLRPEIVRVMDAMTDHLQIDSGDPAMVEVDRKARANLGID